MVNGTANDLSNLLGQLYAEREDAERKLHDIEEKLQAVETTMKLLRGNGTSPEANKYDILVSEIKGKHQLEALQHIANNHKGTLIVKAAKPLMLEAGLIRNPKNALSIIYTLINRSGRFEKVSPGKYRLLPAQLSLPK
jgi:hypothetical protein